MTGTAKKFPSPSRQDGSNMHWGNDPRKRRAPTKSYVPKKRASEKVEAPSQEEVRSQQALQVEAKQLPPHVLVDLTCPHCQKEFARGDRRAWTESGPPRRSVLRSLQKSLGPGGSRSNHGRAVSKINRFGVGCRHPCLTKHLTGNLNKDPTKNRKRWPFVRAAGRCRTRQR